MSGLKVEGFKELHAALLELDVKTGVAALRKAGRKAMAPVLAHQKQNVNIDSGDTLAAIVMTARKGGKTNRRRVVLISVGATKATKGKGADKKKLSGINQRVIAQEYGNEKTKARPFIRPSLDVNKQTVLNNFSAELKKSFASIKKRSSK